MALTIPNIMDLDRNKEAKIMNIVENRKKYFAVSIIVILAGIIAMVINASAGRGMLNLDIDFTGGTSMNISVGQDFDNDEITAIIADVTGQKSPQVQRIVGTSDVAIKMQSIDSVKREELTSAIVAKFPQSIVNESADVSGTVSGEMQTAASKATAIACVAMLIYISIRFKDFRAGGSAIIALLHDCLIVISAYAILRIPVNSAFIAVILTILGYSINSTIVIFDRIRENGPRYRKSQTMEKINKSINQTLARSINTSLTTLFTIGAIYIFGVQSIKEFSLPLIVGIVSGAYSSVFLSGSIWYMLLPKNEKE